MPELSKSLDWATSITKNTGCLLLILSFSLANYNIYRKYASNKAEIQLQITKFKFKPYRVGNTLPYEKQPLPHQGCIRVEVEITNRGKEQGGLVIDKNIVTKKLPDLFDRKNAYVYSDLLENQIIDPRILPPKEAILIVKIPFSEQDDDSLVLKLKQFVQSHERYEIYINYHTNSVDGPLHYRRLKLSGDFNEFNDEMRWILVRY